MAEDRPKMCSNYLFVFVIKIYNLADSGVARGRTPPQLQLWIQNCKFVEQVFMTKRVCSRKSTGQSPLGRYSGSPSWCGVGL